MSTPKTMQAWKCHLGNPHPSRVQLPTPKPGPGEVLIKLLAMGVCHSDCTILALDGPVLGIGAEFILGHEGVGEIVELGPHVDSAAHKPGDRVGVYLNAGCHRETCPECSRDQHQLCKTEGGHYGIGRDGLFAEYAVIHSRAAFHVPAGLVDELAAVSADAVVTAFHAVKETAAVRPEQTIVLFGLGGLGLNGLQTALHLGIKRVLVVDKRQEMLDEAVKLGVPRENTLCTADPEAKKLHEVVAERQLVVDTCIDFVGHADTFLSAQLVLRPAGTLVLVGLIGEQVPVLNIVAVPKGLTIKCSYNGSGESYRSSLQLMGEGVLTPNVQTGSVEDLPQVLKDLDDGKVQGRMVLLSSWKR